MTATGSHYHFDSLRRAPLVRNDMRYTSVFGKKQSDLIRPTGTFPSQGKA